MLAELERSKSLGFLGPGAVADQLQRALALAAVIEGDPGGLAVDLGTGGGLPGLVLAAEWPLSRWLFIEANRRRAVWLREAVGRLGMASRVVVLNERAEIAGRGPYRHRGALVTARSFAPPAATAECAAPLLELGGRAAVTDPPEDGTPAEERWPPSGLAVLGLRFERKTVVQTSSAGPVTLTLLRSVERCADRFPRRTGVPEKRPLF